MDFTASNMLMHRNIQTIGIDVRCASIIARGTFIHQIKPLSKINVMIVFPPLRSVKYDALVKALNGAAKA